MSSCLCNVLIHLYEKMIFLNGSCKFIWFNYPNKVASVFFLVTDLITLNYSCMKNLITFFVVVVFIAMFAYVQSEEREFRNSVGVQTAKTGSVDSAKVLKNKVPTFVQLKSTIAK